MKFEEWWMKHPIGEFDGINANHVENAWNASKEDILNLIKNDDSGVTIIGEIGIKNGKYINKEELIKKINE